MTRAPDRAVTAGIRSYPRAPVARPLRALLLAGVLDSTGLAFGWTVFLLAVTRRQGLAAAALQTSAMLVGIALSAPFGIWLSTRLSTRALLRTLSVLEGICRLALFAGLALDASAPSTAVLVVMLNLLAWTAFAAMRSEASRTRSHASGRSLTMYAAAIAGSEALAAMAAAVLIGDHPSESLMAVTALVYTAALAPQWLVARDADRTPARRIRPDSLLSALPLCCLGALCFLIAAGPCLLATSLAYERYGTLGVEVSAACFAAGTLGSPALQAAVGRRARVVPVSFVVGALMIGCWGLAPTHLVGLAAAQICAGLGQCTLEGDLDARTVARLPGAGETAGLSMASAGRALGGAAAAAVLPAVLLHWALPVVALCAGCLLLLLAGLTSGREPRRPAGWNDPLTVLPTPRAGAALRSFRS